MKEQNLTLSLRSLISEINLLPEKQRTDFFLTMEDELRGVLIGNGDKIDGFVYKTKNLTQFKDVVGNRLVNENSAYIKKLADSISRIGNITPIIVNENHETIDGQRRIRAIRRHGLPNDITYIRRKGTNISTVSDINQLQVKWNYKDWLHKEVAFNNPSYIKYEGLAEKYESLMKSRSLRGLLMNNRVDALKSDVWESGQFTINNKTFSMAIEFLELLKKVYVIGDKDNIFAKDRSFQKALFDIYKSTKKIDEERLLYKIRYGFGRLNIKTDYKTYRKILGELYNSRLSKDYQHVVAKEPELEVAS